MFKKSILSLTILSTASLAHAIELTDYKNVDTAFDEAYLDLSASASSGNQDQTSYNVFSSAFYNKRESEERRVWGFHADGFSKAVRGPNEGDKSESDFGLNLTANTDVYFSRTREMLFYFGAASYAHQDSAIDDNIGATVGIGYGRSWNATPLAKALRVQESLESYGLLSGSLSDDDLIALAAVIGREDEYKATHGADEYKGHWYSDMEAVLSAAGILPTEKLTALATVKLDDVLFNESISARRHGWLVRAGAGFQSSDFSGITDNDPKLLFQFEYAKPYGLKGQLIEVATYEPIFGDNTVQKLSNRLSYSYEVGKRVDWINSWDLALQQADDDQETRFTTNTLTSTFKYDLTNQFDLGLTLAAVKTEDEPNLDTSNDDVATSLNLGISYRLK